MAKSRILSQYSQDPSDMHPYISTRAYRRYGYCLLFLSTFAMVTYHIIRSPEVASKKTYPITGPKSYTFSTPSNFSPVAITSNNPTNEERCISFPRSMLDIVQPVLKLGHSESRARVDAQLETSSACFNDSDLLVFSDLSDVIGGITVQDVMRELPESYHSHQDMQGYITQKDRSHQGLSLKHRAKIDGWAFDKYKFLPMIEQAYLSRPNKPFYFFFEADT